MTQKWKTNQTTSKINKPYINEKPKRQGTHQYPYLCPKVDVVAEKLDPTVVQLCFCRIFQTVRNLQKGTTGMSSEGLKMVGGRYRLAWSGRKMQKNGDPRWRPPQPLPARSGSVRWRLAGKFYWRGRLVVLLLPGWSMYSGGGQNRLPQLKLERPENGSKRPNSVVTILGSFFYGFGAQNECLGARVSFGMQG